MRLVMIKNGGPAEPGVLLDNGSVARIGALLPQEGLTSVGQILEKWAHLRERIAEGIEEATSTAGSDAIVPADAVNLAPPVGDPGMILCAGGNYRSHNAEMGETVVRLAQAFVKAPTAVIASGQPIILPTQFPDHVDYEGELCVVFGRECHNVSADEAMDYVAGYTILNDVSGRQDIGGLLAATTAPDDRWAFLEVILSKHLPTFAPIGPAVLTADEVEDPTSLRLVTKVNGEVRQDATLLDLETDIPHLIERMSRFHLFRSGDVLSTGTPSGTGAGLKPPQYLRDGDIVTIEVEPIGILSNAVQGSTT